MTDSIIVEQSNRMIAQILDDFDRLKEEFLALDIGEIVEKRPDLAHLIILNLTNIRDYSNVSYTFLAGVERALNEDRI